MKLQMHSIHFDADRKLLDFVQKKANKLETFYDRITEGEVFLRINNNVGIANKTVEIKLMVPGGRLFAKGDSNSFEAATEEAIENLRVQLVRHKEKVAVY